MGNIPHSECHITNDVFRLTNKLFMRINVKIGVALQLGLDAVVFSRC